MIVLGCFVLLGSALPLTAQLIWQGLEKQHPPKELDRLDSYDAVVVLSGMLSGFSYKGAFRSEWADPDRFFAGIEVLKSGKTSTLIFTRGLLPWGNSKAEGELLKIKAIEMGVNETQIILSDTVSNTAEEAQAVKKLMEKNGIDKILLITGGTGSFGNAVLDRFLDSDLKEIRIFSRDAHYLFVKDYKSASHFASEVPVVKLRKVSLKKANAQLVMKYFFKFIMVFKIFA